MNIHSEVIGERWMDCGSSDEVWDLGCEVYTSVSKVDAGSDQLVM